jgi:hypothetical protein
MNVKTGDLAIVTKSWANNEGLIVTVGEFRPNKFSHGPTADAWLCSWQRPVLNAAGKLVTSSPIHDCYLKPISGLPELEDAPAEEPIKEKVK